MARVSNGDNDALGVLFRRYAPIVRGVARKVLQHSSEADDMVQDVFLLVRRLCKTFDSSKGPARFWILQMAYHRALCRRRYLTSRHFYNNQDLHEVDDKLSDAQLPCGAYSDSIQATIEQRQAWEIAFRELSENQRDTIRLFFFEGYSFEEIAAKLGQTRGNIRHHYFRGLEKLRRQTFISAPQNEVTPMRVREIISSVSSGSKVQ
jgi:RNA polymerase sigma-70 factor (ECF subfamily)